MGSIVIFKAELSFALKSNSSEFIYGRTIALQRYVADHTCYYYLPSFTLTVDIAISYMVRTGTHLCDSGERSIYHVLLIMIVDSAYGFRSAQVSEVFGHYLFLM